MNNLRLILELVSHHGDLSVSDLRSLSLACKQSSPTVQHEISKRKLFYQDDKETYTYYTSSGLKIRHGFVSYQSYVVTYPYGESKSHKKSRYQDDKRHGIQVHTLHKGMWETSNWIDGVRSGITERVQERTGIVR